MQPWSHAGATGAIRYIAVVTAPPHVLAIDLGTPGPKVALVSPQWPAPPPAVHIA
jgi:hypothetical protein